MTYRYGVNRTNLYAKVLFLEVIKYKLFVNPLILHEEVY